MKITANTLALIAGKPINANMKSVVLGLDAYGRSAGLDVPHRLAHYLAQLCHESGAFHYDREVWGPTPQQKKYDTGSLAKTLGNTPEADGDGKRNAGRGPIQITGGHNLREFTAWVRRFIDQSAPDFFANPDLINTDPWEGLGPVWYWMTRNLNRPADQNDIEMVTRGINGGVNGLADRIEWYTKVALVLAGYGPNDVARFQADAQKAGRLPPDTDQVKQVDGVAGPKTRAALHMTLADMAQVPIPATVAAAPVVVEVETAVPAVPAGAEKVGVQRTGGILALAAPLFAWLGSAFAGLDQAGVFILLGAGLAGVVILLWRGELIAARARTVLKSFDGIGS